MSLLNHVKNGFIGGLILIAPLVVTVFVLRVLSNWALTIVNPLVRAVELTRYTANVESVAQVFAFFLIVLAITILGYLARVSVGKRFFGNLGKVVNFVPLVNTIYSSVRQVATALVSRDTGYESVVLVEYPRKNVYTIGLVTGESPPAVEELADQTVYNVYIPNSPNPTGGRLLLIPETEIHEVDVSVRQGMRLIVTTGMGDAPDLPPLPGSEGTPSARGNA